MIAWIKKHSPIEVYFLTGILTFCLFASPAGPGAFRLSRIGALFQADYSIVYRLLRGIGDEALYHSAAELLYWILLVAFVGLMTLKARKISAWLWDR